MTAEERRKWRKKHPNRKRFEKLCENNSESIKECMKKLSELCESFKKRNPKLVVVNESCGGHLWKDNQWKSYVEITFYVSE